MWLKLFHNPHSIACHRIKIALQIKGLAYDAFACELLNEQNPILANYQQLNPDRLLPCLGIDEQMICQSMAIIEFLNDAYPSPPLLPRHAYERALVRSYAQLISSEADTLGNVHYLKYTQTIAQHENLFREAQLLQNLHYLQNLLISNKVSKKFCYGDQPTIADIYLIPALHKLQNNYPQLDSDFPLLMTIYHNCLQRVEFQAALPNQELQAEVI